jgi:hypothetical protein
MINNSDEIKAFLDKYPHPQIKVATTIKDEYIACVESVPTICGPELYVNPNTRSELDKLISDHSRQLETFGERRV